MSGARGIRATDARALRPHEARHGFTGLIPADSFSMGTPCVNTGAVAKTGPFLFARARRRSVSPDCCLHAMQAG